METMRGQAVTWKNGKVIPSWYTMGYDCTGKSAPHVKGAIMRQLKKAAREEGAEKAEFFIHYSVYPSGPFITESNGVYLP